MRPFSFSMPLNFATKENVRPFIITFDGNQVAKEIQIEDWQSNLINDNIKDIKNKEDIKKIKKSDF